MPVEAVLALEQCCCAAAVLGEADGDGRVGAVGLTPDLGVPEIELAEAFRQVFLGQDGIAGRLFVVETVTDGNALGLDVPHLPIGLLFCHHTGVHQQLLAIVHLGGRAGEAAGAVVRRGIRGKRTGQMENRFGPLDVKAVLYSHSHVDHFGGAEGAIDRNDVADPSLSIDKQLASGKTVILAPEGFLKHAISENVYAGIAMARRAQYQYGTVLEKGEKGALSIGIGMGQSTGTVTLIAPTYEIGEDVPKLTIDGLEIEFQLTPGTEAPAEMNAYFPKYRALWMAENCTGTLHNLYTLRGAQVRDANDWAKYIIEADQRFCDKTDVVFQSHNWPHWGEEIHEYLLNTAAIYKFIHDQTLHYMNMGYTSNEIAAMISLPDALEKVWYTRQYYGTLPHNAKAIYQKYLGWYDANPVNLDPLPPSETAKKMVEYLGSTEAVLLRAKKDYNKGEYQWVAQITKELVFADPSNQKARNLCADALEQLGYQAESGAWRNAYLMGAAELRNGNLSGRARTANGLTNSMRAMTVSMLLDYIAILTDANAAQNDDLTLNLTVTDENEQFYVTRKNGVLLTYPGENRPDAQASVTCRRLQLFALMTGQQAGQVQISGDATVLKRLLAYASKFEKTFNVIEP